jgi:hypothetical protein
MDVKQLRIAATCNVFIISFCSYVNKRDTAVSVAGTSALSRDSRISIYRASSQRRNSCVLITLNGHQDDLSQTEFKASLQTKQTFPLNWRACIRRIYVDVIFSTWI